MLEFYLYQAVTPYTMKYMDRLPNRPCLCYMVVLEEESSAGVYPFTPLTFV